MASFMSAASAPVAPRSSAVTGAPSKVKATVRRPRRALRSSRSEARHSTAMISEAAVMVKPVSRGVPWAVPPRPVMTPRRERSLTSRQRCQTIRRTSMPRALPCWTWLSTMAARVFVAAAMAWKSPVKWRLMSSIGTICEYPPPAAPPLMPMTGPCEGSRRAAAALSPRRVMASARPMRTVDLPSPAGVGDMPVTSTSFPASRRSGSRVMSTLALWGPKVMRASGGIPARRAISVMGSSVWAWAMATSVSGWGMSQG